VFNRLPLVYGDQIDVKVATFCVYNDFSEYLEHNGMKDASEIESWAKEAAGQMGVPIFTGLSEFAFPKSAFPASLAVMAAMQQGHEKGARFMRSMLRQFVVEGKDTTQDPQMDQAAKESGLDLAKFDADAKDENKLMKAYEAQGESMPHLPIGFYNVAVTDGERKTVIIDHAFEPAEVEAAVDWLSGGKLKKSSPTDVLGYLKAHGLAPLVELRRAFSMDGASMKAKLDGLVKEGKARTVSIAGSPHWTAR